MLVDHTELRKPYSRVWNSSHNWVSHPERQDGKKQVLCISICIFSLISLWSWCSWELRYTDNTSFPRGCLQNIHVGYAVSPLPCCWCWFSSLSSVHLFFNPKDYGPQAPLSMGFPRQEYWSGLPFPSPTQESNLSPPALQVDSLMLSHKRSPSPLHKNLQIVNFQRCKRVFMCPGKLS